MKKTILLMAVFALPMMYMGCNYNPVSSEGEGQLVMVIGHVFDGEANTPLQGAAVTLVNGDLQFDKTTDEKGLYYVYTRVPETREVSLSISMQGYEAQNIGVTAVPDTRVFVPDVKLAKAE